MLLWIHTGAKATYTIVCLSVATSLFLLQKILWIGFVIYRNVGSGSKCKASITRYSQIAGDEEVLRVQINLKRRWDVKPGHFVYLCLPHLGHLGTGFLEAHPYMISWFSEDDETSTIVLLVQSYRGFSRKIRLADTASSAIIDGPYGGHRLDTLASYDKMLFMASGIGISAHLLSIRHLLLAHEDKTVRVRRLSLVWFLDTKGKSSVLLQGYANAIKISTSGQKNFFSHYMTWINNTFSPSVSSSQTKAKDPPKVKDSPFAVIRVWQSHGKRYIPSLQIWTWIFG